MAKKSIPPPTPQPANLSQGQIKAALPKLARRLEELKAVKIEEWNDALQNELDALQARVEHTLVEVFGPNTLDYQRYNVPAFDYHVAYNIYGTSPQDYIKGYSEAVAEAIVKIRTAIQVLQEQLADMGATPEGQALQAYQGLDLHSEIDRAAGQLYRNGHYANAIEDAVKALNGLVRLRSGVDDKDGSSLMEYVFSPNKPVLKFNDLVDQSDKDEQKGFMMMFSGAVAGLRNPRAHKLIEDDPERAIEFIAFVSLLAKLLDGAKKAPSP